MKCYDFAMNIPVEYVSDVNGNARAVQISMSEWKKIIRTLRKYEQALKLKSDLRTALVDVSELTKSKQKQTLGEFLNEI